MKTSREQPPNWAELEKRFGVKWGHVAIVYGDTCYSAQPLADDVLQHEAVHAVQQAHFPGGAAAWWKKYMESSDFRLWQESEAYREQIRWIYSQTKDKNMRARSTMRLVSDFCTMYDIPELKGQPVWAMRIIGAVNL